MRVAGAGREADPAAGESGRGAAGSGSAWLVAHAASWSAAVSASAVLPAARCTSTSSASSGAAAVLGRVDLGQRALEDVAGERDVALGQVDGRERTRRVGVAVEAVEQLLGLLEPTLPHAQVGQARQRAATQRPVAEAPEANRLGQRGVGFGPRARPR